MNQIYRWCLAALLLAGWCPTGAAAKKVLALQPVQSSVGINAADLLEVLQVELSHSESFTLVDREQMKKILDEQRLLSQTSPGADTTERLRKLVGADYFASGSLRASGNKFMATLRLTDLTTTITKHGLIMLETNQDLLVIGQAMAKELTSLVGQLERENAGAITATPGAATNAPAIPKDWKLPTVMIIVREMHVQRPVVIDPAAETELIKLCIEKDFKVVDSEYVQMMKIDQERSKRIFASLKTAAAYAANKGAEVLIYGEALAERGAGLGDFEGCRARVEIKAIATRDERILLADSAYAGAVDTAEAIAGKHALQKAAQRLADASLYKLAETWHNLRK